MLVLPDPGKLTAAQQQAVAAFAAGGGAVIENDPAWAWADPAERDAAFAAFRAAISPKLARDGAGSGRRAGRPAVTPLRTAAGNAWWSR